MLGPNVLENVLSRTFSLNGLAFQYSKHFTILATFTHSYTQSYTDGGSCHARCKLQFQEQFGVQYLAQGHWMRVKCCCMALPFDFLFSTCCVYSLNLLTWTKGSFVMFSMHPLYFILSLTLFLLPTVLLV